MPLGGLNTCETFYGVHMPSNPPDFDTFQHSPFKLENGQSSQSNATKYYALYSQKTPYEKIDFAGFMTCQVNGNGRKRSPPLPVFKLLNAEMPIT